MARAKNVDWLSLEAEWRAGGISNRKLANKYNVSEGAIRKRAVTENWVKSGSAVKRQIVEDHFNAEPSIPNCEPPARSHPNSTQDYAAQNPQIMARDRVVRAALSDIDDMELGLQNARDALLVAQSYLSTQFDKHPDTLRMPDPRFLKAVIDANGAAIDQIRRIRNLDHKIPDELEALKILAQAGWLPNEILASVGQEFRRLKPALKDAISGHFSEETIDAAR